jgi:hypothetical protein
MDTLYPFFREKPYPKGYTAPDIFEHYQGTPILDMPEVPLESNAPFAPDVFTLRAEIQEEPLLTWPILHPSTSSSVSLSSLDLYTDEGKTLIQQRRTLSLTLRFQGLCLTPNQEGTLLPWDQGPSLLPFKAGDTLATQKFSAPPETLTPTMTPVVFSFGGIIDQPSNPLSAKPLYFFVESAGAPATPQIKLLLDEDIDALRRIQDCPLILPDRPVIPSLDRLLTESLFEVSLNDASKTLYKAVGFTFLNRFGRFVDIMMKRF